MIRRGWRVESELRLSRRGLTWKRTRIEWHSLRERASLPKIDMISRHSLHTYPFVHHHVMQHLSSYQIPFEKFVVLLYMYCDVFSQNLAHHQLLLLFSFIAPCIQASKHQDDSKCKRKRKRLILCGHRAVYINARANEQTAL